MQRLVACFIFTVAVSSASPAVAQQFPDAPVAGSIRPERPYRGLFGGGVGDTSQLLTASGTLGLAGYRQLVGVPTVAADGTPLMRDSWAGRMTGGLSYSVGRTRWNAGASIGSSAVQLGGPGLPTDTIVSTHLASARAAWHVSENTLFTANQEAGYRPVYLIGLLSTLASPATDPTTLLASGEGASAVNYLTLSSELGLTHAFSKRLSTYGSVERRSSRAPSLVYNLDGYDARAGVRIGVTRNLGLRLGYAYEDSKHGSADAPDHLAGRSYDTGIDFNRPLSLTRRTTLKFNGGVSALRDRARNQRYVLIGGATLTRELGRSGLASIAYSRDTSFLEAFNEPLIADSLSASLSALWARRLEVSLNALGMMGRYGFGKGDNGTDHAELTAGAVYGITRYFGLGGSYGYFLRSFQSGVALPPGFLRETHSHSAQAYVTLWAPLLQRTRRPNAAR